MTQHQRNDYNSREVALEPKKAHHRQQDGENAYFSKPLEKSKVAVFSSESAASIDSLIDARTHRSKKGQETSVSKFSSVTEHDIIESVAWTKKLNKFLNRPAISTMFETYVTKSRAASQQKPTASTPDLPKIVPNKQRHHLQNEKGFMLPLDPTRLSQEFLNQADSVEQILEIASERRLKQLEFQVLRSFAHSTCLSSEWDNETETEFHATAAATNRRFGRRTGLLKIPPIGIKTSLQKQETARPVKVDSVPLSARSDVSVPAYLFDEQISSKAIPDFNRIQKRSIKRQQDFKKFGALSILGPNAESDSDPCSDECEGSERDKVSLLNAHKPTLIHEQFGIETADHDELNSYSDFGYAVSYYRAFETGVASKGKQHIRQHDHSSDVLLQKLPTVPQDAGIPDSSINWKTSMEMPTVAASEYCRFCMLHKLPIYHNIIRASTTHSHHKNVSFAGDNINAMAHYFKHAAKTIQELFIMSCSLGNEGFGFLGSSCFHLMKSLTCIKLIDCNFCEGGSLIAENLAALSNLSSIKLSECKLRDADCAKILIGLAQSNSKCVDICVDHNFASTLSTDALSKCFRYSRCFWKVLDLSWNRMSPSRIMCSSIRHCDNLTEMNLSWNGLRDEVSLNALCYALRFHPQMQHINLQNCGLGDKHALLLTELLQDCVKLVSIDLRNNSIHSYGCRSILRVLGLRHESFQKNSQDLSTCQVMLPVSGGIPDSLIDYDHIAGPAEFSLRSPCDRHILKNLLLKREKHLVSFSNDSFQTEGNGESIEIDKLHQLIKAFDVSDIQYHNYLGVVSAFSETSEDRILDHPTELNKITLTIQNLCQTATDDMLATSWEIDFVKNIFASSEFTMEQKVHFVSFLLGGSNFFRLEQLKELIFLIKPGYRVDSVKLALTHCWERDASDQLLGWLSASEQIKVQTLVSDELLHFSPNNPTGHYRLILSNRFDRDICFKLLAIRNEILDVLKRDKSYQIARHKVEKVAFNVKLEGSPFTITPDWNVPTSGTIEMDFVYCLNPDPNTSTVIDDETVFQFTTAPDSAQRKQIKILRNLSNQFFFNCTQGMRILQYFRDDLLKIESLVILFSRIIDYPGFQRLVKALDGPKQIALRKRIGMHNIYNDCNAVGFHELDLTDPQQRFICARLVDLAVIEPGENMCGCRYNEIDFDVPASWLEEVPQKGIFTVFYCRSKHVIQKIFQKIPTPCIPTNLDLLSPPGTEWVTQAKRTRIKLKLSLAFTNVEEAFNKMDEDGGGSLSRVEFSRGLRMLGVQVTAYELLDLVDLLDEDGSGFIELEEMVSFWESC
jgi:hypothetical protein